MRMWTCTHSQTFCPPSHTHTRTHTHTPVRVIGRWPCLFPDSSDKLRQPKIGVLMKQVMGNKEDIPGTFSRGGERLCVYTVCVLWMSGYSVSVCVPCM